MSWHYAAKKVPGDLEGEYEYTVVEVFPSLESDDPSIPPHTGAIRFYAASPEELARWLRVAAEDIERHKVIEILKGA